MKLKCEKYSICIIPESEIEEVYLENVLDLHNEGDICQGKKVNATNLSCWGYLEIKKQEEE